MRDEGKLRAAGGVGRRMTLESRPPSSRPVGSLAFFIPHPSSLIPSVKVRAVVAGPAKRVVPGESFRRLVEGADSNGRTRRAGGAGHTTRGVGREGGPC